MRCFGEKGLPALVKRAIELVKEVIQRYGENVRVNLHASWFGRSAEAELLLNLHGHMTILMVSGPIF